MKVSTTIAALAAAAATVSAQGSAIIVNHCPFDTYVWPVDAERDPQSPTTIPSGGSYSEVYHTPSTGGVSLKVSNQNTMTSITQFEYTLADEIFYDGSNINCDTSDCPFWQYNLYIEASEPSCPGRPCPSQTACDGFYQMPNDVDTLACASSADTILHICLPNSELPTSEDSVSIPAGAPSSSAPPAPSTTSAPPPPTTTAPAQQINEALFTTFVTVTATPGPQHRHRALDAHAHAHARRHMHHRS
jgi:hypothetical protein